MEATLERLHSRHLNKKYNLYIINFIRVTQAHYKLCMFHILYNVCFIDYTKAFYEVQPEMLEILGKLDLFRKIFKYSSLGNKQLAFG